MGSSNLAAPDHARHAGTRPRPTDFGENPIEVLANRVAADAEPVRDFLLRDAFCDEGGDFDLTLGKFHGAAMHKLR
jgi:hypothetical protein